ncbi:DUF2946 domain-containing protein [Pectobacterium sp. A5351]|uniref:DUF2946 domain-containing protein n=1 Tax=Pectobacterium sp. A5351 TaxID=2914983 RepID=UPI00232FC45D|nr:DUF2946 domain-containing protein [Pectobacterium sp. A5351]WCG84399.1 DUF2946 domain-containing protein [Pectobacterium sp. A5351]
MLLSALRRRSFPAWVGIFAILTIFVAPVISQTQVLHEHGATLPGNHSGNLAEQSHTGHTMSGHHARPSHHSPSSPSMMMDHAACGYCVLFLYTPALFAAGSPNPILTTFLPEARVIHFISRIVLPERYASPVVRAPPF